MMSADRLTSEGFFMFALHDCGPAIRLGTASFDDEFTRMSAVRDRVSLEAEVQGFASGLGFERYSVLVFHDDFSHNDSCVEIGSIHNAPTAYFQTWDSRSLAKVDPVNQHCKRSSAPAVYGQQTYVSIGSGEKWEHQSAFGYAHGISLAFHLPRDRHVLFGVDRRSPLPSSRADLVELVARVQLFGTFVQTAALSVFDTDLPHSVVLARQVRLSRREYECLQWAAEGKTAWETGMILSIAEGSVAKVLAAAIRKLECATKPQAVVKALRLGLIH